uniref:Ubiquitin-like domain-containing protein n=1 Tax=Panagrolaimus sp. ES5 TaxID=591445 RepID=A0AC34F2S0_9BILA
MFSKFKDFAQKVLPSTTTFDNTTSSSSSSTSSNPQQLNRSSPDQQQQQLPSSSIQQTTMPKPPIKKTKVSETVVRNIVDEYDVDDDDDDDDYDEEVEPFRVAFTKHLYEEDEPEPAQLPTWTIELKVQVMDGKTFKIKANQFSNVSELKKAIRKKHSIPIDHQHLFYNCKLLNDGHTLIYYEVDKGVTLKMYVGQTIERCEFYSIRADLLDSKAEQLELPTETLLSLCHFGQSRPPSNPHAELTIQIMNGRSFTIFTSTINMVGKLKEEIAEQEKIPIEHQNLFFNCQLLDSSRTLICYEIEYGSIITMHLGISMTGCRFYYVRPDLFDMQYSCEYANTNMDNQTKMFCASRPYIRPLEARRFAIKVRGKYEDMKWLGQPSTSTREIPGEWPMAYHGTSEANILEIVNSGFDLRKCVRMAYGKGIYCSPDPKTALWYSKDYECEINKMGTYRVILQCRANPEKIKVVRAGDNQLGEYWTVPDGADLRPYGVCVYFYPVGYQHTNVYKTVPIVLPPKILPKS